MSVQKAERGSNPEKQIENSLEFFKGPESVNETKEDFVEYQKVSLAALTMCCTCDNN